MRAGDVIFVRGAGLVSKLVLLFDKGSFSHVAIAVSESEVLETNWNMKSKIVKFHYTDYEEIDLLLSDNQRKNISMISIKYEGKMYDYLQILSYVLRRRLNNPRHLICSELVYSLLREIEYIKDESLKDSTPNELYEILKMKVVA